MDSEQIRNRVHCQEVLRTLEGKKQARGLESPWGKREKEPCESGETVLLPGATASAKALRWELVGAHIVYKTLQGGEWPSCWECFMGEVRLERVSKLDGPSEICGPGRG